MKNICVVLVGMALVSGLPAAEKFDRLDAGKPPSGWETGITGAGEPRWTVEDALPKGRVLRQSGVVPKPSYPLCLRREPQIKDGHVQVKFKTLRGQVDQAAGVVWRFQDANNYYICRANALEDNIVLYKVQDGKRTPLPLVGRAEGYGLAGKVASNQWHTLRVDFKGSRFVVRFNGKKLFQVEDATFSQPGRVGLWTKADSVTEFDDFAWGGK